jgi:hypothetical protein
LSAIVLTAIDRVSEILGLGASVAPDDNTMPERTWRELSLGVPKCFTVSDDRRTVSYLTKSQVISIMYGFAFLF